MRKILELIALIGKFWHVKLNGLIFRWNILILGSSFLYLILNFDNLPPEIPLYFSQPWGAQQLAPASQIFFLPIFSFLILLINNFMGALLLSSHRLFALMLIISSLVFSIFSSIAVFQIINLVN